MRRALALVLFALLCAASAAAQTAAAVDSISQSVADADRSARWFEQVLGFERVSDVEVEGAAYESLQAVFPLRLRVVRLALGDETLELHEYLAPRGRAMPADTRGNDLWFQHVAIVVRDMDAAYARLREHRVAHASSGPQTLPAWNPDAGGIRAFYFRDPDGHFLELIWFPPGKGDPRWQRPSSRLFLGIDHTAITVADTDESLRFWRDTLGFRVAGASENWGPEQERLNAVFGARLRITGLRAPGGGPGVELLEYLAPRGGRPRPADAQASDLLSWQTGVTTRDAAALAARVRESNGRWVSPGAVELPADALGFRRGLVAADPDGHALRIAESNQPAAPVAALEE
jgi:catechol 2,3-dioxygenase-like lactoylglutathione lyase family enzyme